MNIIYHFDNLILCALASREEVVLRLVFILRSILSEHYFQNKRPKLCNSAQVELREESSRKQQGLGTIIKRNKMA